MNIFPSSKSQAACLFSLDKLPVGKASGADRKIERGTPVRYLWTLTTPDVVEFAELNRRWLIFLKRFKRASQRNFRRGQAVRLEVSGVRVFEMHPGKEWGEGEGDTFGSEHSHGWHIHLVLGERVPVQWVREQWDEINGGSARIHVEEIPLDRCQYVAKYLGKQDRWYWMRRYRLWAKWGPFRGTRVADIVVDSPAARAFRRLVMKQDVPENLGKAFRSVNFKGKIALVQALLRDDLLSGGRQWGFYEPIEDPEPCGLGVLIPPLRYAGAMLL